MATVFSALRTRTPQCYSKRISTHIAYALVVYTLMLIFLVSPALESKAMAIWPYFLLVVLVAAVIVPCRNIERHWKKSGRSRCRPERALPVRADQNLAECYRYSRRSDACDQSDR